MAKNRQLKNAESVQKRWDIDTANYYEVRIGGARAILIALVASIRDFQVEDGRATDEAVVLSLQHVFQVISDLEKLSYALESHDDLGGMSLQLMWARALIEVIVDMFEADVWEVKLEGHVLVDYLGAVRRILESARELPGSIHARKFSTGPAPVPPQAN